MKKVLKTISGKFRTNGLLKIGSIFVFVLLFGGFSSAYGQNYFVDRGDDNTITTCDPFTPNDCTLRGAIQRANTDGVASQIQLAIPQNFGQTIILSFGTLSINNDQSLLITSDPIIIGDNGINRRTVSGGFSVRVFSVNPGANVTFRNIGIQDGRFSAPNDGAAIDNNGGTVTIDNCAISNNQSTDDAGAVKNTAGATMTINNSEFLNYFAALTARGGAIFNEGTMTITNSLFRGNKGKNGGAIANSGTLTIRNTTISGNESTDSGGGIYTSGGTVTV